ncbi:MAG TPA: CHAD domain-containing protein [Puia sp.]|nr:CHAD domain-containing protein [Puia sp.]
MLTAKHQKKYIRKLEREAIDQLKAIAHSTDEESIHRFRIAIKKMKALQSLLKDFKKKNFIRPVKKAFKATGGVRDIGNANAIELDHFKLSTRTSQKRKSEFEAEYRKLARHILEYKPCFAKTKKKFTRQIGGVHMKMLKNHFGKELAKIPRLIVRNDIEAIHESRKKLKNLFYLHNMLPEPLQRKLNIRIKYIDDLQDKIGKWHDLVQAEPMLKKRIGEKQLIVIRSEKQSFLDEIRNMTSGFRSKSVQYAEQ